MIRFLWFLLALLLAESDDADPDEPGDDPDDSDPSDDTDDDDEPIRDPLKKLKAREEQVGRLAKKLDKKDKEIKRLTERVAELEESADGDALRASRLEAAFLRAALTSDIPLSDLDTAWTLGHSKGFFDAIEVAENGSIEGMEDALAKLVGRYPWLGDEPPEDDEPDRPLGRSGRPVGARRDRGGKQPDSAGLNRRFPALRNRVRAPR